MVKNKMQAVLDRFERAAMAYERLGKLTRDDEKTRRIRKDTIAELAAARTELIMIAGPPDLAELMKTLKSIQAKADEMGGGVVGVGNHYKHAQAGPLWTRTMQLVKQIEKSQEGADDE